jgi:hypothetical protein
MLEVFFSRRAGHFNGNESLCAFEKSEKKGKVKINKFCFKIF